MRHTSCADPRWSRTPAERVLHQAYRLRDALHISQARAAAHHQALRDLDRAEKEHAIEGTFITEVRLKAAKANVEMLEQAAREATRDLLRMEIVRTARAVDQHECQLDLTEYQI